MEKINVTIKTTDKKLKSFCVEKNYLDRLLTNIKLYQKNMIFISEYINQYAVDDCNEFIPSNAGIIFIDMVSNVILDSQCITGVNKITPTEIKRSKKGNIVDETDNNSIINRFIQLVDNGYLKGFNEWRDNGNHLNIDVLKLDLTELIDLIMQSDYHYGQFVFKTTPYKVETFNELDRKEQTELFKRAKALLLIPTEKYNEWEIYLKGLTNNVL